MWIIYLLAIVVANLLIVEFAVVFPAITAIVAFTLIGLDLALRDSLHDSWIGRGLLPRMTALIVAGGIVSYLINADAATVAIGSSVAFALAATGDTIVYHILRHRKYLTRANASNITGAAIDSLVFPLIALSFLSPSTLATVIVGQFLAKSFGGAVWSGLISWGRKRRFR